MTPCHLRLVPTLGLNHSLVHHPSPSAAPTLVCPAAWACCPSCSDCRLARGRPSTPCPCRRRRQAGLLALRRRRRPSCPAARRPSSSLSSVATPARCPTCRSLSSLSGSVAQRRRRRRPTESRYGPTRCRLSCRPSRPVVADLKSYRCQTCYCPTHYCSNRCPSDLSTQAAATVTMRQKRHAL